MSEHRYRLYVNAERTVMVRVWDSGEVQVATRESSDHGWGLPVVLKEEEL